MTMKEPRTYCFNIETLNTLNTMKLHRLYMLLHRLYMLIHRLYMLLQRLYMLLHRLYMLLHPFEIAPTPNVLKNDLFMLKAIFISCSNVFFWIKLDVLWYSGYSEMWSLSKIHLIQKNTFDTKNYVWYKKLRLAQKTTFDPKNDGLSLGNIDNFALN